MKLLLDTHIYAWWVRDDRRLSRRVREAMISPESQLIVSAVVPWEIATKFRVGKWPEGGAILADLDAALVEDRLTPLPITLAHATRAGLLPWPHRDPFDRMLAAQAEMEGARLVTADPIFAGAGVEVMW